MVTTRPASAASDRSWVAMTTVVPAAARPRDERDGDRQRQREDEPDLHREREPPAQAQAGRGQAGEDERGGAAHDATCIRRER